MSLPETTKVLTTLDRGWLTVTLNSPENRNALSAELTAELSAVLDHCHNNYDIRGITLRGAGGTFCAGGDLKSFGKILSGGGDHDAVKAMNCAGGDLFTKIEALPQVVIAYVEGAAIAGGLGMMCCADIIVVHTDAKFALTETALGIVPAQIAPIVVARVGIATARRLMLTAARFTGAQTKEAGLSDYVVSHEGEFDEIERDIRTGVLSCAPRANALTKEILLASRDMPRAELLDYAADKFADAMLSDEGKEGIMSFVTKQKPSWAAQSGED
ncbi:enoyl-CoA hydratase/isomerase family protein [Robiginitomaculum antarcticum]|uniref:enoyl-CoA hydratase/isomerase family protein n=1 Tax=Robiginitomaculum antarcticum TaxID=437507 RepID=UPI00036BAF2B|nr:enoyl-CoA hydratase/isomerase family protein [Robiginitomaculum antarcticum]